MIEPWGEPPRPRVVSETVHLDGKPIFEFTNGEVHLFNDRFEHKVTYEFDWHRSALATIVPRRDNQSLTRFKLWIGNLYCFRLNPFGMGARAEGENLYPNVDLSNIAAWYRHLVQADPKQNAALLRSLRESLDGFNFLQLESAGENVRLLVAEFGQGGGKASKFSFNELSDGQRCLIALYTILHFVLAKGGTVILDEPDNFLSLREIQPWLLAVDDTIEESRGQVLMISHHPEIINQWAPTGGVQLYLSLIHICRARSRLTGLPGRKAPRLERRRVSGATSAPNVDGCGSTTVRQTPLTETLSPARRPVETSGARTVSRLPVARGSRRSTAPSSSMMPVNITSIIQFATPTLSRKK